MIYIKRSVEFNKDVTWVAASKDDGTMRCRQLYAGTDVNGAIAAATEAGLARVDAVAMATSEIARCKNEVQDTIGAA